MAKRKVHAQLRTPLLLIMTALALASGLTWLVVRRSGLASARAEDVARAGLDRPGSPVRPGASPRVWRYIVIHHSASPSGSAARFDREHRAKGWHELGYHFVIGNGTETPDGRVEIGPRWSNQKSGAHTRTADGRFNEFGIGICLVGNFEDSRPSKAQLASLTELVTHLMRTYDIPAENVLAHGECKPTDCPGKNLSVASLRARAAQLANLPAPANPVPGTAELLRAVPMVGDDH